MNCHAHNQDSLSPRSRSSILLLLFALGSALIYLRLIWVCVGFSESHGSTERPVIEFLTLLCIAYLMHLAALAVVIKSPIQRSSVALIIAAGIVFRLLLLFSHPTLERDYFRYLWDGAVTAHGISPYRYSPRDVLESDQDAPDPQLQALVASINSSASLEGILRRVHYPELRTIYPPTSQAVFAIVAMISPASAGIETRILILKVVLILFDIGTMFLVLAILLRTGAHAGWLISYAWCPLILKEIANSAHLDSIAVFGVTLASWLLMLAIQRRKDVTSEQCHTYFLFAAGVALGLSIGAKLYPIAIVPLFIVIVVRICSIRVSILWLVAIGAFTFLTLAPMLSSVVRGRESVVNQDSGSEIATVKEESSKDTSDGLTAFLQHWEMNDFLFLILIENFRPSVDDGRMTPWFVILPNSFRDQLVRSIHRSIGTDVIGSAFLVARCLTASLYALVLIGLCYRIYHDDDLLSLFPRQMFYALGWFWLLLPTQNPWYWLWALPFLSFAQARSWLLLSGLTFAYYLRFWLRESYESIFVLGTRFLPTEFFDYVVVWIEFAPFFILLALEYAWKMCRSRSNT